MRLRCFIVIFMALVQTGTGQNFKGEYRHFPNTPITEITDNPDDPSIFLEPLTEEPEEDLFVIKGIKGVYLELSIPLLPLNALVTAVRHPQPESDSLHQIRHFNGSQSSIKTFVPAFRSSAFNGLLNTISGKYTIDYRLPSLKSNICNSF